MSFPLAAIARIRRQRQQARASFRHFFEFVIGPTIPNRVPAAFHEVIQDRLQAFIEGPGDEILIITLPPGGSKTLIAARAFVAWVLGRMPTTRVVGITNIQPLAEESGHAVREIIRSPEYQLLFPNTDIDPTSGAAAAFRTTTKGRYLGFGLAGAKLGRRSDLIVIDDLLKGDEQIANPDQLRKLHNIFETEIVSRMTPRSHMVVIQQRLHANDIVGYLHKRFLSHPGGRRVTELRLPMLCDDPKADPLGRAINQPLWPEYWTPALIADAQIDDRRWRTMYMQKPPADEGSWCSITDIVNAPAPMDILDNRDKWRVYIVVDCAWTQDSGDFTAMIPVAVNTKTGHIHIVGLYHQRVDADQSADEIIRMNGVWHPVEVLADDDTAQKNWVRLVTSKARALGSIPVPFKLMPIAGRDKEKRASNLQALIRQGKLHMDTSQPWASVIANELVGFPYRMGAGVDDCVDALSLLGRRVPVLFSQMPPPSVPKAAPNPAGDFYDQGLDALHEERERLTGSRYRRI